MIEEKFIKNKDFDKKYLDSRMSKFSYSNNDI